MKGVLKTWVLAGMLCLAAPFTVQAQDNGYWTEDFESDNWGYDDYGYYDEDFIWETDEEWYSGWYEDDYTDWYSYDDYGDAGLFDV